MNTKLRQTAKNKFEKDFLKLMNNAVFEKNYGKCEKTQVYYTCHNRRKKKLFGVTTKLTYDKIFHRKYISKEMEKTQIIMDKSVYLRLSILHLILQL